MLASESGRGHEQDQDPALFRPRSLARHRRPDAPWPEIVAKEHATQRVSSRETVGKPRCGSKNDNPDDDPPQRHRRTLWKTATVLRPPNVPPFSCAGTLKATLRRRSNARQAAVPSEARSAAAGDNATGAGASCNGLLGSKPMIATVDPETKHRSSPGYSRNAGSSSGAQKPERGPIAKACCGGDGAPARVAHPVRRRHRQPRDSRSPSTRRHRLAGLHADSRAGGSTQ
jgi:hypothetical protein